MNILHAITPKRLAGAERVCIRLCRELRDRGHRVEVATKPTPVFVEALNTAGVPNHPAPIASKFNFASPWRIARIAREMQADVIHTHLSTASLWGSYAGWICRTPTVAHIHAMNTAIWFRFATRVVPVSNAVREHVMAQGVRSDRAVVVHNAVDIPEPLSPDEVARVRREIGVSPGVPLIAVVAHLSPKKGHRMLLDALHRLQSDGVAFECVCMGEGRAREQLVALADELGLAERVHFLGFREDCLEITGASDLMALASVGGEGLPMSLLEAAASGKPSVATRLSGIPELIEDGETGFLVASHDASALARRLGALIADPGLRLRLGQAARERVQAHFTIAAQVDAIEAVYREALGVTDLPATKPAVEP